MNARAMLADRMAEKRGHDPDGWRAWQDLDMRLWSDAALHSFRFSVMRKVFDCQVIPEPPQDDEP